MKTTKRVRREARRLYRACLVGGLLDEDRVLQAVEGVAAAHLRGTLAVLSHFQRLVRLDLAPPPAGVGTARSLRPHPPPSVAAGPAPPSRPRGPPPPPPHPTPPR